MSTFSRRQTHSLLLALSSAAAPALFSGRVIAAASGPWPQFHGDAQHSGLSSVRGPRTLTAAWYALASGDVEGSPVIDAGGNIYFASTDGGVYGLSSEGGLRWAFNAGATINGSVVLGNDGRVVFGDSRGRFRALNAANGSVAWTATGYASIRSTPAVSSSGLIYFGTDGGTLVALEPSGTEHLRVQIGADVTGAPALGLDGSLYWGALDNRLRRMAPNGEVIWTVSLDGPIVSAPAIGPDGTVYVGSGASILAVDGETGAVKWRVGVGAPVMVTPAVAPTGTVYAGADNGVFTAVSPDGNVRSQVQTGGQIRSSAAVGVDGAVYVGSGDSIVYAFDAEGQRLSTYKALDSVNGGLAIDARGVVYVGSRDNRLYALKDAARSFTGSPADRLGGDLLRDPATGKVYVLVDGALRHIPDPATQSILGLTGRVPLALTAAEMARYPQGPALPSLTEGVLLRQSNGPLTVVQGGKRVWIRSLSDFLAGGYTWEAVVGADDIVVRSVPLAIEPGMLLKGGGERTYFVEAGQRRWIPDEGVFSSRGFLWSNVHFVSDALLQSLPEGQSLG